MLKTVKNGEIRDGRIYETIYYCETVTPPIPEKHEIDNWDLPQKQQKYRRTSLPKGFAPLPGKSGRDIKDYAPEFQDFIRREWKRRIYGYWFYNDGEITYLPGEYYFRLTYWKMDEVMEYRDRDRRKAMYWRHWNYADNGNDVTQLNQKSYGVIYAKGRRDGATYDALGKCYEVASRVKRGNAGMQSKDNLSAKRAFERLILSWRKLPSFFSPTFDGTTAPKTELRFFEPARKGQFAKLTNSNALESSIAYRSTTPTAFDGEKLALYYGDEWGKIEDESIRVTKTWDIVRPCLSLGGGSLIVGKAYITSTVEDMEKGGGKEFKLLWDSSNPRKMNVNGRTATGLCRLFLSSADGLEGWVDEYGRSVEDGATPEQAAYLKKKYPANADMYQPGVGALQYIQNQRQALMNEGNFMEASNFRRKFPLKEEDCFAPAPKSRHFNTVKIDDRLDKVTGEFAPRLVRGNFMWKNGERDTRVVWHPDNANGRWLVSYLFENDEDSNHVEKRGNLWIPKNKHKFCAASDPIDLDNPDQDEKRSRFVATAFRKYDMTQPEGTTNKFVALYQYRPPKASMAFEDTLLMCVYYGMDLLPEMQKPGLAQYFYDRGYAPFVGYRPDNTYTPGKKPRKKDKGINSSKMMIAQIYEAIEAYVEDHVDLIDFEAMLQDLVDFNPADTKKTDVAMSMGYNLLYAQRNMPKTLTDDSTRKVQSFFKVFKK
jgi:hypothetical protein